MTNHKAVSTEGIIQENNWPTNPQSANADLLPHLTGLTAKSRDLTSGNGIGKSIIDTITDKVVGQGLKLIPQIDYKTIGWDVDVAKAWNEKVEGLWNLFANSKNFDVEGRNNFNSTTRLVLQTRLLNGEVLALPYWNKQAGSMFNTQIQLVECDRLLTPPHLEGKDNIKAGIKLDKHNRPLKYYISKTYPDDELFANLDFNQIAAQTAFGRKQVIHIFEQERVGQLRGKPKSMHLLGRACDFPFRHYTGEQRIKLIQTALELGLTVGVREDIMHIDNREDQTVFGY